MKKFFWNEEKLRILRGCKGKGLTNCKIAKKLHIQKKVIDYACTKYRILLNKEIRKKRLKEAGLKGHANYRAKREKLARISNFDENLGYILGVCFGDGSAVDLGRRGYIELRTVNESFAKTFLNRLQKYTKVKPKYYINTYTKTFNKENRIYENVKYHEIFFYNVFFVRNIIRLFGKTTKQEWRINSNKFISFGPSLCKGVIQGLFDSEGTCWIEKENRYRCWIEFSTTNKKGAEDFFRLLLRLGFDFRFNIHKRKNNIIEYKIRSSKLEVIKKFYEKIGFNVDYKQQNLEKFIKTKIRS